MRTASASYRHHNHHAVLYCCSSFLVFKSACDRPLGDWIQKKTGQTRFFLLACLCGSSVTMKTSPAITVAGILVHVGLAVAESEVQPQRQHHRCWAPARYPPPRSCHRARRPYKNHQHSASCCTLSNIKLSRVFLHFLIVCLVHLRWICVARSRI